MSSPTVPPPSADDAARERSFVETALELSGKSAAESRATGRLDRADEQVETLFAARYRTAASPAHRAVWDATFPAELFSTPEPVVEADCRRTMEDSLAIVRRHRDGGTLHDAAGKIDPAVLAELGGAGYWGLLVDREHGGRAAPFLAFARFLTEMALVDPTVAGLASVHGCIGAVDPLRTFGTPEQKRRMLPDLAAGKRLSAFALTEPAAGSDLTALRTTARLEGDHWVVDGEKLFITNAIPGRTIGLVCLVEGRPAVLIADLPEREDATFQVRRYGLHALRHSFNNGLVFRGFRVPRENLLDPGQGDGLTIAYHGLNLGRVALCATAAGMMRVMLASMLPWARFRRTYGEAIVRRELVRRRLGRLAALIVGCDAIRDWCAGLLDRGYRGEMECIIAKIFGSESQKEAAIELLMKTHGGRGFLHGHLFGDNVHEYLAPCIYEGEGEMLGMAFYKSLVKEHGKAYFEPIGRAIQKAGLKNPNPANPLHAWKLRGALVPYAGWRMGRMVAGRRRPAWPAMPPRLRAHVDAALEQLDRAATDTSAVMVKHQLKLADRQCRMAEESQRIQDLITVVAVCRWAADRAESIVQDAADVLAGDLLRRIRGKRPGDGDLRRVTRLGEAVADGGFPGLTGIDGGSVMMDYPQP
ncbi:MAG: acyl-CoA dehydrogenase family protein [Planctomycetaceae bacterium]